MIKRFQRAYWSIQLRKWLEIRASSKDEYNEKLCYCGHTYKCSCGDPDKTTFIESVQRGTIIPKDPENGWKTKLE